MNQNNMMRQNIGMRLKRVVDDFCIPLELLSKKSGIPEKRLIEIVEARGRRLKIEEIATLQINACVSADYLASMSDVPFTFEPTKENIEKYMQE